MFQRLPKVPVNEKFDAKNGWLPSSFTEQCREIVNKYVLDAVQEEMRKDSLSNQLNLPVEQMASSSQDDNTLTETEPITYCSRMLSNIKKGIYKSANILPLKTESKLVPDKDTSEKIDTVDLVGGTNITFYVFNIMFFNF